MRTQDELRSVEILPNGLSTIEKIDLTHDYENVLAIIGFGKTQWIVLLTSGLLLMMVINESMGMGIISIASQCDFATTTQDRALLTAACFLGILCSSYFWGYLSDTIGRRRILMYATLAGNFVSFSSMFIANFWIFFCFRFVVGLLIAGASSTTYAYLGEFFIARHRPIVINYASMFVGIAMSYVPAIAWLILSMNWSFNISEAFIFRPWRLLILFNLLPGMIAALVLIFLPESPRFLMAISRMTNAYAAVDWICHRNTGRSLHDLGVYKLKEEHHVKCENILSSTKSTCEIFKRMWKDTRPLFKRPHNLNFLISCIVMFGLFLSSSGMGLWFADIQNRVGSSKERMTVCNVIEASITDRKDNQTEQFCNDTISTKSFIDSIIFGVTYTCGYIVVGTIINPIGRKKLIVIAMSLSSVCGIMLLWLMDAVAIVVCFCLFLVLPGLCISVLSGAVVDLVPTYLRGKAMCICLMLGRSGAIIGSNIIGILLESYCMVTFGSFSVFVLICGLLTILLPI